MSRFALTLLLFFLLHAQAWAGEIALILADDSAPYREFAGSLQKNLQSGWKIAYTDNNLRPTDRQPVDLIVTAGSGALRTALAANPKIPILATLLPEYSYKAALLEARSPPLVSAIYLDQPARRQARLLRLLFPEVRSVGLLVSDQSPQQITPFRSAMVLQRMQLLTEQVSSEAQILPALENLLARSEVLLAIPDALIYSRSSIRPLLITAYRFQRPVIGFSAALAKAGALAALYSTPAQIGRQAGTLISTQGTRLPSPRPPTEYSLTINQSVADAFGLRLPDETDLLQKLLTSETEE
jgi:ABC-type uncharacterized transport system substrate-binding protein